MADEVKGAPDRRETAIFVLACAILGGAAFWALELALPRTPLAPGHEIAVFVGFFLVPLAILLFKGRKVRLGGLDRGFLMGFGIYMCFLVPLLLLIPFNQAFFGRYRMAPAAAAAWALLTLIQVSSVDFFTKRIVQLEVEGAWGAGWGMAAQFAAWSIGHVPEYIWLSTLTGPAGALLFLGVTGALTGLLYHRTKNVLGMMVGHWALNILLAAAAVIYLG